jgi:LPS O-antigen subunit length determinant protein (WzzB/FepE family)
MKLNKLDFLSVILSTAIALCALRGVYFVNMFKQFNEPDSATVIVANLQKKSLQSQDQAKIRQLDLKKDFQSASSFCS